MRPVPQVGELSVASLSRLSHLVKRLERRDLVRREPDPEMAGTPAKVSDVIGLYLAPPDNAIVLWVDELGRDEAR